MLPIHGQSQSPGSKAWFTLSTAASNSKSFSPFWIIASSTVKRKGFLQCLKVSYLSTYIQIAVKSRLKTKGLAPAQSQQMIASQ